MATRIAPEGSCRRLLVPDIRKMLDDAVHYMETERYSEAEMMCKQVLQYDPKNIYAFNYMGAIASKFGRHDMALAFFHAAHKISPDNVQLIENMAGSLYEMGDLHKSEIFYKQALSLNDNSMEANDGLGLVYAKMSKYAESEKHFKRAIEINENYWVSMLHLGDLYRKTKKLNQSIKYYREALLLQPDDAVILQNLAALFSDSGEPEKALPYYEKALKIDQANLLIYSNMISCLFSIGEYEKLQNEIITAEKEGSFSAEDLCALQVLTALTFFLEEKIDKAEKEMKKASPLRTTSKDIPDMRGLKVYLLYLEKLITYRLKNPKLYRGRSSNVIYIIGESHSLSFAHTNIQPLGLVCSSKLVMGGKAWHFGHKALNRYKAGFIRAIKGIPEKSVMVVCFGEIDCRMSEGIFSYYKKNPTINLKDNIRGIIDKYVDFVLREAAEKASSIYFCGVPAIAKDVSVLLEEDQKTLAFIVMFFNEYLSEQAKIYNCGFVDVYGKTVSKSGFAGEDTHIDSYHLYPHIVTKALEDAITARQGADNIEKAAS